MDILAKPTCCPYAPVPHRQNHVTGNNAHGKGHGTTEACLCYILTSDGEIEKFITLGHFFTIVFARSNWAI